MPNSPFKIGLFFATTAVLFWGMLPIALKLSAGFIDPVTLTWFRFFVAFIISLALQSAGGKLNQFKQLTNKEWLKLSFAAMFSIANYVSFVYCLDYLAPGPAQLNFQTAPFFLAFGGALFFKERLQPLQMACFATLAFGMLLFFHPYLDFSNEKASDVIVGVMIVQFSAMSWVCYALLQKSLIEKISPGNILLYIYGAGLLFMLPFNDFKAFGLMTSEQWLIALFCAFNTLIAYGSFAQSMRYWSTAQVGAMVTLTPIVSFALTDLVATLSWWPDIIVTSPISLLGISGILIVVSSVLTMQLLPMLRRPKEKESVKP